MGSQNFETFKPLSEEEEKHVVGGGTNNSQGQNPACAQIAQQLSALQVQIQTFQSQGLPAPVALVQDASMLQAKLGECLNQPQGNNPGN